jgi:hypothetical protein
MNAVRKDGNLNSNIKTVLVLSCHLKLVFPKGDISSDFPTKMLYVFPISQVRATYRAHLIVVYLITLNRLAKRRNYYAPHYVAVSILLSLHHSLCPNILLFLLACDLSVSV